MEPGQRTRHESDTGHLAHVLIDKLWRSTQGNENENAASQNSLDTRIVKPGNPVFKIDEVSVLREESKGSSNLDIFHITISILSFNKFVSQAHTREFDLAI